jgi:plasmid maintenance system antidote protein VapI
MDLVSIKEMAKRLGVDPTTVRRLIEKYGPELGIEVQKARGDTTNAKWTNFISREDADRLKAVYESRRGTRVPEDEKTGDVLQSFGYFYLVQLVPEALPNRIKIGYTDNLEKRLAEHQTAAPTARVIRSWPCKRSWDYAAMDSLTREGCTLVLNEVFEGDPDGFINRGNAFFALMPNRETHRDLAQHSPLRNTSKA